MKSEQDLQIKMKVLMGKLQVCKKEKEALEQQNTALQNEVLGLQSSLRSMVGGFKDTGEHFPLPHELSNQISEFYKSECFDAFFDVLAPELNLKGIIYFYTQSMQKTMQMINEYFNPLFTHVMNIGCLTSIDGPVINVLRKSFQGQAPAIARKCFTNSVLQDLAASLSLEPSLLQSYFNALTNLMLNCFISDPPLHFDIQAIGQRNAFNGLKHEPLDGFLKSKEECVILLPPVYKNQDLITKALVLSVNYQLENL